VCCWEGDGQDDHDAPVIRGGPNKELSLTQGRHNFPTLGVSARIIEAKREGWLGEVQGLQVSLAGTKDKIAQIDITLRRRTSTRELGMPSFSSFAGRTTP
jgi:hypothetical protein